MQAIQAATSLPAEMLGQEDKLGSLQAGRFADIIAVASDPLQDISELAKVKFVMSNGKIIKNDF